MAIDISALSAKELDELIAVAAKRRAELEPAHNAQPPEQCEAVLNPAWHSSPLPNGVLFILRHPGLGWLAFALPHEQRVHLTTLWLHQSLLYTKPESGEPANEPAPSGPTAFGPAGSSSLH